MRPPLPSVFAFQALNIAQLQTHGVRVFWDMWWLCCWSIIGSLLIGCSLSGCEGNEEALNR